MGKTTKQARSKKVAPSKSTGGGGFAFEDRVGAYFLAHMLAEKPPIDDLGKLVEIKFQVNVDGWRLDDIMIITEKGKVTASIKSLNLFSNRVKIGEFVKLAWQDLFSERFNETDDYIGLFQTKIPEHVISLIHKVKNDQRDIRQRIRVRGWANEKERELFDQCACPDSLQKTAPGEDFSPERLISKIQILPFDFQNPNSDKKDRAITRCQEALKNFTYQEAERLWDHLTIITSEIKSNSGALNQIELFNKLKDKFDLKQIDQESIFSTNKTISVPTKIIEEGIKTLTRNAEEILSLILKRRTIELQRSLEEITDLIRDMEEGKFTDIKEGVKANIYYWAARLNAVSSETLNQAEKYIGKLTSTESVHDLRIIKGLIKRTEKDFEGALKIFREIDTDDGRTNLFVALNLFKSKAAALQWLYQQNRNQDPNALTAVGWAQAAIWLAEENRWEEASTLLADRREFRGAMPDLAYIEGVINAGCLLPDDLRTTVLNTGAFYMDNAPLIEGMEADQYRQTAINCFHEAQKLLQDVDLDGRAQTARTWEFWARLTDKKDNVVRNEIKEYLKDERYIVDLLPLAYTFKIAFNSEHVRQYLEERKQLGGFSEQDLIAEFIFKNITESPGDFAQYIEKHEARLKEQIVIPSLIVKWVEALVKDGQISYARDILERREEEIKQSEESTYNRLFWSLNLAENKDIYPNLRELYEEDSSLINLHNLVLYLKENREWNKLYPYLQELFRRQKNVENARLMFHCMWVRQNISTEDILKFLENNQDLVEKDEILTSNKAVTLTHLGRCQEAKEINDKLISQSTDKHCLQLDINLALQMGDWERFPEIANREWGRINEHSPDILLHLAKLASNSNTLDQAVAFIRRAVEIDSDNPHILAAATGLLFQIGREEDVNPRWIDRSVELSKKGDPVQRIAIKELVEEIMPKRQKFLKNLEQKILKNEIPISLAMWQFGSSISRLFLQLPEENRNRPVNKKRAIIPAFGGNLLFPSLDRIKTLGLDMTSAMTLFELDLLKKTIDTFDKIALAPDTMLLLLNQKQKAQFHQPKRAQDSEKILSQINNDNLKILDQLSIPPGWLVKEVGQDLAELLATAEQTGGVVVHPLPVRKLSSLNEEKAKLKEYQKFIISTRALAKGLRDKGILASDIWQKTDNKLSLNDQDETNGAISLPNGPIYLYELALIYIQFSGILEKALTSNHNFIIHPSSKEECRNVVNAQHAGENLTEKLNPIRLILKQALAEDKAKFLPRDRDNDKTINQMSRTESVAVQFMQNSGDCDAVCIDERYFNAHPHFENKRKDKIPVICTLHLLAHLHHRKEITTQEGYNILHKLRDSGFSIIPPTTSEIEKLLRDAQYEGEGNQLIEGAELRVLRENIENIHALNMLIFPDEGLFVKGLAEAFSDILLSLWSDNAMSIERAAICSSWAWKNLKPYLWHWDKTKDTQNRIYNLRKIEANFSAFLQKQQEAQNTIQRKANAEEFVHILDSYNAAMSQANKHP